ncbi:MAG: manganese efflux pump MntP family protein [Velocimicrobium sp.]
MELIQICLLAVGLAMDAFAVSICKGLKMKTMDYKYATLIAAMFGIFQAVMPLIGWVLGKQFERYITNIDHWIAFFLLAFIGGKMIVEAFREGEEGVCPVTYDVKDILMLAIATSIDALAVGITFAFLNMEIIRPIFIIGGITFVLSMIGVMVGNRFGAKYKSKAELAGGIILVLIGLKILFEHLGILML